MESLQDQFAPSSICFGCGPANPDGLRVKSHAEGDEVVADWPPKPHHEAFPGILNGGIIGTLLDCHCNWTSAYHLMQRHRVPRSPVTVTAEYTIRLKRPTPSDRRVHLTGRVVESTDNRMTVEAALSSGGQVTATCGGGICVRRSWHFWQLGTTSLRAGGFEPSGCRVRLWCEPHGTLNARRRQRSVADRPPSLGYPCAFTGEPRGTCAYAAG